jgi:hypothetical protein
MGDFEAEWMLILPAGLQFFTACHALYQTFIPAMPRLWLCSHCQSDTVQFCQVMRGSTAVFLFHQYVDFDFRRVLSHHRL